MPFELHVAVTQAERAVQSTHFLRWSSGVDFTNGILQICQNQKDSASYVLIIEGCKADLATAAKVAKAAGWEFPPNQDNKS